MEVQKKTIGNLDKCYSLAKLNYNGKEHLLVAAEKVNKCLLYSLDGVLCETIWEEPGGVMSMVQVPGTNGQFLATQRFYSPNDSKEASIVVVTPDGHGKWDVKTLVDLPFVHRFDILTRDGVQYLIACTLKSGHTYKDDWSAPGKVYAAKLPGDLSKFDEEHQLELTVIKENMLKNHGYSKDIDNQTESAVISCESGVYQFTPPKIEDESWKIVLLTKDAASDAVLLDIDRDGQKELITMAPFHGDSVTFYRNTANGFQEEYQYPGQMEFLHAMFGGNIKDTPVFICGSRKGRRSLRAFYCDEKGTYQSVLLDEGCGAANVIHYIYDESEILVATNREINEIAMYTFL